MRIPLIFAIWFSAGLLSAAELPVGDQPGAPAQPKVLSMEDAQRQALRENPSLAVAAARVGQARAIVRLAEARFLPAVSVSGSWMEGALPDRHFASRLLIPGAEIGDGRSAIFLLDSLDSARAFFPSGTDEAADALRAAYLDAKAGDDGLTMYQAGAHASWLVFDGFSRMFQRAAAIQGEKQTLATELDVRRLTLGAVAAAYCQAQYAREQMAIAQADFAFNTLLVNELATRVELGKKSLEDSLDFRVRMNVAEANLLEAGRRYRSHLTGLAVMMALPGAGFPGNLELEPLIEKPDDIATLPALDEEIAFALAHRPDLAAARAELDTKKSMVGIARSTFYPTVRLGAGYDAVRRDDMHFENDDFGWNVMLSVSGELFVGGARLALVDQSLAARAAARAELAQAEILAVSEVRNALDALASAVEQYRLQVRTVETVERARELARNEYSAGRAPTLRLNEAQSQLVAAQSRKASALATLRAAWQMLRQATARSVVSTES